jgi:hypothetical protein
MQATVEIQPADKQTIIGNLIDAAVPTEIEFFVVELTPDLAAQLLELNTANRPISTPQVKKLAKAMAKKDWRLTGQTIVVSKGDVLMNGQHTCKAVIDSGETIYVAVAYGVDDAAFDAMDDTKKRSAGDVLAVMGEGNAHVLGSILAHLQQYEERGSNGLGYAPIRSNTDTSQYLAKYSSVRRFAKRRLLGDIPSRDGVVGACLYLFHQANESKAEDFWSLIRDGGCKRGHPIFALASRLSRDFRDSKTITDREYFAIVIKAWNYFLSGRETAALTWRQGGDSPEPFPKILGL